MPETRLPRRQGPPLVAALALAVLVLVQQGPPTPLAAAEAAGSSSAATSAAFATSAAPHALDAATQDQCFCQLTGTIDDCCCSVEDVDVLSAEVRSILAELVQLPFFRFYKVALYRGCPFWPSDGACHKKQCAVALCEEKDLPTALDLEEPVVMECGKTPLGDFHDTITASEKQAIDEMQAFSNAQLEYCDTEGETGVEKQYVNLQDNPERFTGYTGSSPANIWMSIYKENCFQPAEPAKFLTSKVVDTMCMEKRVFYRVVSGLHAAINLHVAAKYPSRQPEPAPEGLPFVADEQEEITWGPNLALFEKFFDPDKTWGEGPSRLKNVYFTYLLLLRAVVKVGDGWTPEVFFSGDAETDRHATALVQRLVHTTRFVLSCPSTFDESLMFNSNDEETAQLKEEFRLHFRNISRIMDCVGCETCRLWGKLQVQGLGAAMKILFSESDSVTSIRLRRNDIVALFNSFARFSEALQEIETFRQLKEEAALARAQQNEPPATADGTEQSKPGR